MKLILLGNPISTNQLYRHKGHMVYMSVKGKQRKKDYQFELLGQRGRGGLITRNDLSIMVWLYFGDKRTHDIDNFTKILFDACNGIIWRDDSQIKSMTIRKHYDKESPRTEIEIYAPNPD